MTLGRIQQSLGLKITVGYYLIAAFVVLAAASAFEEMKLVEDKVFLGERISELFDTTLEIRRYERNYFLYHQAADIEENQRYAATLSDMLGRSASDFAALRSSSQLEVLRARLERYQGLIGRYAEAVKSGREGGASSVAQALEPEIRAAGRELVETGEKLVATEKEFVRSALESFRKILFVYICILVLMLVAIGRVLSRRVVLPLKAMEQGVDAVIRGKQNHLPMPSQDREVAAVANAFNHMLRVLEQRRKDLVRSEKLMSMGTMLSGVAHELNNPLSNISSSCQILQEELGQADLAAQQTLLGQIDEQTVRARNIVRSLLDFARERHFRKEAVILATVVDEMLAFIRAEVPPGVAVHLDIGRDTVILADKQRLQQALLNLVKNAIDALGEEGNIRISAKFHPALPPSEEDATFGRGCQVDSSAVDITVADDGPGIAPDVLPRIFDPFFTTKDVGRGMGLGLFIVHEIVQEHGGCITARSEPGSGTAFHIRLPLSRGAT